MEKKRTVKEIKADTQNFYLRCQVKAKARNLAENRKKLYNKITKEKGEKNG